MLLKNSQESSRVIELKFIPEQRGCEELFIIIQIGHETYPHDM